MIGGKRVGAGRKRVMEGELLTTVAFGLAQQHVEAIKQWQADHGCRSASEAVRQMIDFATKWSIYSAVDGVPLVEGDRVVLAENLLAAPAVLPAGDENSPDWQWKRQPISRPTKESRPKRAKPNKEPRRD